MRVTVWMFFLAVGFLTTNGRSALSETGTLQKPATSAQDEQPVPAPSAAPRTPVQHVPVQHAPAKPDKTPAATAKGPVHPSKPPASAAKPAPSTPPPVPADAGSAAKPALLEKLAEPEKPEGTASKLPRFAALRSDDVNMRTGPGTRYRIEWVYRRRDLPVEIEREFDTWRWVRDPEGIQGWVHQATLMGRRNFIVQKADATLRSEPSDSASPVAVLRVGVIGRIRSCEGASEWCNVQSGSYRGYLRRTQVWGVFPGEAINP